VFEVVKRLAEVKRELRDDLSEGAVPVVLPNHDRDPLRTTSVHLLHQELATRQLDRGREKDFGGLNLTFGIQHLDARTEPRVPECCRSDGKSCIKCRLSDDCVDASWEHEANPVCNHIHEIQDDAPEFDISLLGSGAWRSTHGFEKKAADGTVLDQSSFAFKMIRNQMSFQADGHDKLDCDLRKEATIMDRLSSSPHVVDLHAHCGTAMIAECMKEKITDRIISPLPGMVRTQEELDSIQAANENQVVRHCDWHGRICCHVTWSSSRCDFSRRHLFGSIHGLQKGILNSMTLMMP
jgi:hypothetical protein